MAEPVTLESHDAKLEKYANKILQEVRELGETVKKHEQEEADWYNKSYKTNNYKGENKMDGINTDKVYVNTGGGSHDGGNMAAVIAALGNRNQGNDNAALIAALGNRGYGDNWGGNNNMFAMLAMLGLLRGRGFGDDCGDGHGRDERIVSDTAILNQLATIAQEVPQSSANVIQTILAQTNANQREVSQLALGIQQGLAGVKDSATAQHAIIAGALAGINQNVSDQGCRTREAVAAGVNEIVSKIDANLISELQRELGESRHHSRARDTEVNVTQTVAQNQAQAQFQTQIATQTDLLRCLMNHAQVAQNSMVNLGTMIGNSNSANNTKVF